MAHYHLDWTRCTNYSTCPDRGKEGHIANPYILFAPVSGCSELAAALMRHYEVNPAKHPEALAEIEQAIGEEMLDIGRNILREHGIAYPGFDPAAEGGAR